MAICKAFNTSFREVPHAILSEGWCVTDTKPKSPVLRTCRNTFFTPCYGLCYGFFTPLPRECYGVLRFVLRRRPLVLRVTHTLSV